MWNETYRRKNRNLLKTPWLAELQTQSRQTTDE